MSSPARIARTHARTPLARRRVAAGMTQRELAEAAGIPLTTYSRLEHGQVRKPAAEHLLRLAEVLGREVVELLDGKAGAADPRTYGHDMGRARGATTAAAGYGASRRSDFRTEMNAFESRLLDAANERDYAPFLAAVQGRGVETDHLLGGEVPRAVAQLAVRNAREDKRRQLLARVTAGGVPARAAGSVLDHAVRPAADALDGALRNHLQWVKQKASEPASTDEFEAFALRVLAEHAAAILGEPHNDMLLRGTWETLRRERNRGN